MKASTCEVAQGLRYLVRFPNREVRASLTEALLFACSPDPGQVVTQTGRLPDLLAAADFSGIKTLFTSHSASIPHDWFRHNKIARAEGYYASVFYTFFASFGLDTIPEDTSSNGRLDMAVRLPDAVWLFEFKMVDDEPDGSALQQVKDRGYADKYRADNVPIHLVGIEFSRNQRTIVSFDTQTISASPNRQREP
ncbi:MAG: PD-(D/E)XK nuclease domain-containing protein [Micrococcales bacterium]|nr:PD-(D/E)XK nuclease domain-containing protein [Micrococcales bacterium]